MYLLPLSMKKKITISVLTQEGNYGWEATGHGLYSVYIFLSAQVVLQVDTFRTIINFPKILCVHFQQLLNGQIQVSQHFQQSQMSNSYLPRPNAHSQEDGTSLYLVRLISELTSLNKLIDSHLAKKPKAHLMSREELALVLCSLCSFSSLLRNTLKSSAE